MKRRRTTSEKFLATKFEDLSNELIYELFDYFDYIFTYEIFSNFNQRFHDLFQHASIPIRISFPRTSKSKFHSRYIELILPNLDRILSLTTSKYFLDYLSLSSFSSLQYLILHHIESSQILSILPQLIALDNLLSLTLHSIDYFQNENLLYQSIFQLKALQFCKLTFPSSGERVPLPLSTTHPSQLRSLILHGQCRFDQLISLLSYTPQLETLTCQHLYGSRENDWHFSVNLKSLSVILYRIVFDEMKLFLTKIGKDLRRLKIEASNDQTYLQADQWEDFISYSLSNLSIFSLSYSGAKTNGNLLEQFSSPFWREKHWFFQSYSYQLDDIDYEHFSSISNCQDFLFVDHHPKLHGTIFARQLTIEGDFDFDQYSISFPRVKALTLKDISLKEKRSFFSNLSAMFSFTHITSLILKNTSMSLHQLSVFPNLRNLSLSSFPSFRTYRNCPKNSVEKLILDEEICQLKHSKFLSEHFSRLQTLEISIDENDFVQILNCFFSKFVHLCSLFLFNINSELQERIEQLYPNYQIERLQGDMDIESGVANSPKPGDTFFVRMNNGSIHPAEILETRTIDGTDQLEYFVHYLNFDHRNDQWIGENRLTGSANNEQTELINEQLNDSTNSLSGRKRPRLKRRLNDVGDSTDFTHETSFESTDQNVRRDSKSIVKYIEKIWLGQYEMDCWYHSPFPDEYGKQRLLYICEHCMKYMRLKNTYIRHLNECPLKRPPGTEIYRDPKLNCVIYEVDGAQHKLYCQNLCLVARLFLESKVICFNVAEFLFYVLLEYNDLNQKERFVGYFSKEKDSAFGYNLSCLLCLPPYQRKGYGKLLIQFSYELSKIENVVGGPEIPVSDLGQKAYSSYWTWALLHIIKEKPEIEVDELSAITSISTENCIETLSSYGFIKYWRQSHFVCASRKAIEARLQEFHSKKFPIIHPQLINWQPRVKGKAGRHNKMFAF